MAIVTQTPGPLDQALEAYKYGGSARELLQQLRRDLWVSYRVARRLRDGARELDRLCLLFRIDTGIYWHDYNAIPIRELYRIRAQALADAEIAEM